MPCTHSLTHTRCASLCDAAVVKVSRLTKVKPLYRGWTDATLPKTFFKADKMGIKGGIEYGFSSTTTERKQAAHYAAGNASTILALEMGMVDRGADIRHVVIAQPHTHHCVLPIHRGTHMLVHPSLYLLTLL